MLILPCCSVLSDGVCLSELKGLLTYLLTYLYNSAICSVNRLPWRRFALSVCFHSIDNSYGASSSVFARKLAAATNYFLVLYRAVL